MYSRRICTLVSLAGSAICSPDLVAGVAYRSVAMLNQEAPGMEAGTLFGGFEAPVINNLGQTAFFGGVYGPPVTFDDFQAVWIENNGVLSLVARGGMDAPGAEPGVRFWGFERLILNNSGHVAFASLLVGDDLTDENDLGVWTGVPGVLTKQSRTGDAGAGVEPGVAHSDVRPFAFTDANRVVYRGRLTGPGVTMANDDGIWSNGPGGHSLHIREGQHAPGTPAGVTLVTFGNTMSANSQGDTTFLCGLAGPGTGNSNLGIWRTNGSATSLVVRVGSPAPGAGAGMLFTTLLNPFISESGSIAFRAGFSGPGLAGDGIWVDGPGGVVAVARTGMTAPGTPASFSSFRDPVVNRNGHVAFWASLTGPTITFNNNLGIWTNAGGVLHSVVRNGDVAPGTESGVVFESFLDISLNASGQVAFLATLKGPSIPNPNAHALYVSDLSGQLHLLARIRQQFDVNPDEAITDLRTIDGIWFLGGAGGGTDGRASAFNDRGEVAFRLTFDDGTQGVFVASVPGPAGVPLLLCWWTVGLRRRTR